MQSALKTRQPSPANAMKKAGADSGVFQAPEAAPANGVLGDYGAAPAFLTTGTWFNTEGLSAAPGQTSQGGTMPLMLENLRGKVVVVDFWTYSCVNCVRTLPYLKAWYDAYRDKGLVIVGVHTPEFEFEKSTANVARAIHELGVTWPVVQDNDYAQWNAYANQYWPAHYFIDAKGRVRYFHFGEGEYDVSEKVIQSLLKEAGASVGGIVSRPAPAAGHPDARDVPRIRQGPGVRLRGEPRGRQARELYSCPAARQRGVEPHRDVDHHARSTSCHPRGGTLQLGFDAKNVFLVIEPEDSAGAISVFVDGKPGADTIDVKKGAFAPRESRMYQLVGLPAAGPHVLRLEVKGKAAAVRLHIRMRSVYEEVPSMRKIIVLLFAVAAAAAVGAGTHDAGRQAADRDFRRAAASGACSRRSRRSMA